MVGDVIQGLVYGRLATLVVRKVNRKTVTVDGMRDHGDGKGLVADSSIAWQQKIAYRDILPEGACSACFELAPQGYTCVPCSRARKAQKGASL